MENPKDPFGASELDAPTYSQMLSHSANYEMLNTGSTDIYDRAKDEGVDPLTGTAMAVGAGFVRTAQSIANSGVQLYNIVAPEALETDLVFDTANTLRNYSDTWANFYERNETSIGLVSDLGALFVPGTAAMKLLKVAQRSNAAISTARAVGGQPTLGNKIFSAFDLADTQGRRMRYLERAKLADAQGAEFSKLASFKYAAMESINENVVFSVATAGMLNQSSLFDDYDTGDFVRDFALGFGITGVVRGLQNIKAVRTALDETEIAFNLENRLAGNFENTPADERISMAFKDLENIKDQQIRQRVVTRIEGQFYDLFKGTREDKTLMASAFREHIKGLNGQNYNELWLGTKEVRMFDPQLAAEPNALYINARNGQVKLLEDITPTAGDMKFRMQQDGQFTLRTGANGKVKGYTPDDFTFGKAAGSAPTLTMPAYVVDGYALSVSTRLLQNQRNFPVPVQFKTGKLNEYAINGDDWTHLQAGYIKAMRDNVKIPTVVADTMVEYSASDLLTALLQKKSALVREAMDAGKNVDDIAVRYGVDMNALTAGRAAPDAFIPYASELGLLKARSPTHIVSVRNALPAGFSNRANFLAHADVAAMQQQRIRSYRNSMSYVLRGVLNTDLLPNLDPRKATQRSETAGLLFAGAAGSYGGPTNLAETAGTILRKAKEGFSKGILDTFVPVTAPFAGKMKEAIVKRAELSSALAYVRSMPAQLELKVGADGTGTLFDRTAGLALLDQTTGQTYSISKETTRMLRTMQEQNVKLIRIHNADRRALGKGGLLDDTLLYAPPTNITREPFGAFVKGLSGQVRTITAPSEEILSQRMAQIQLQYPQVKIDTFVAAKAKTKEGQKLYDEYKASGFLDEPEFDFAIARSGAFAPVFPKVDETLIEDTLLWFGGQADRLLTRVARNANSHIYDELDFMGARIEQFSGTVGRAAKGQSIRRGNAFHDLIKTSLDYSKYSEHEIIASVNQTAETLFSKSIGQFRQSTAEAFAASKYSEESVRNAVQAHMAATGQVIDYTNLTQLALANKQISKTALNSVVTAGNGFIATLALGLDMIAPAINAIGYTIVGWPELRSMAQNLKKGGDVDAVLNIRVPGHNATLPSPLKLMASVIRDSWNPTKRAAMMAKYEDTLDSKVFEAQESIQEMIKRMASGDPNKVIKYAQEKVDFIKKYTVAGPNAWMQLLAHESADRLARAAGLTDKKQIAAMRLQFSKRVNGNYTASQRGALTQGPIGHAFSLFQTWTLGVVQNFGRYVANKEGMNIAALLGAQSAVFGIQSNPAFKLLNQHLVARDPENQGLYQGLQGDMGDMGDFLLYGIPSSVFRMSLYTRGDITPHNPAILPTDLASVPIIGATTRTIDAFMGGIRKIAQDFDASGAGAISSIDNNLMSAIALSGLNRPLAGLATLWNGYSQTSAQGIGGQVIDEDIMDISAWTRVIGSRPLTEQKVLDKYYRFVDANAEDQKSRRIIGATIRTKMASGNEPTAEDLNGFASDYIEKGGNPAGVDQFFQQQMLISTTSMADRLYKKLRFDGDLRDMRSIMSAEDTPGFTAGEEEAPAEPGME